ncbi:MAG: hypothetical protein IPQ06_12205 [Chitinophagaceae bacterium]|nr:hypothetical protein [Chitinophagaceae bacterium]MBL0273806.1 hypothetical protein [Chitinophagaceae bacterium]
MKKIFNNNRLIALAFFTVFSVATSPAVMAHDKNPSVPVEMKFAGLLNNQPMFQLSFYGNAQQDEFTISIRDENGNSLYRENIKGENFTKKFLLNTDEIGDDTLLFEILSKKTGKTVVYSVNRFSRLAQDFAQVN